VADKKYRLYFTVEEGQPKWESPGQFERITKALKPGVRQEVTIKPYRPNRSNAQNAYMWGVVYKILSEETGYTEEEVHQLMTEMFLSYTKNGKKFVKSTTKLKTVPMEDYLSKIRMWASMELNCYIPLPGETHWTTV
jgi:hypothetical protein